MPARFLSDEQRRRYGSFNGEPSAAQLARYFHLDATDRAIIDQLRRDRNRLGFALQLGTVRFLGVLSSDPTLAPPSVIRDLAQQLEIEDPPSLETYRDGRSRKNHAAIIRQRYGYRDFATDGPARFRLTRWLYTLAWAGDDRPSLLLDRATSWLTANKVLLPGVSTLERLVGRIRHRVHLRLWRAIAGALSEEQRARIEALVEQSTDAFPTLEGLRATPSRRTPMELIRQLERIEAIRAYGLRPDTPTKIPIALVQRLSRIGRAIRPSALVLLQEPRRTATIAALFHTAEATALDDAIELFEVLVADVVSDAANEHRKSRLRSLRDLDAAALKLNEVTRHAVFADELPLDRWRAALFEKIPQADIEAAMARVEALVQPPDSRHYEELCRRWRRTHRLFASLLERVAFEATPAGRSVKEALDYLRTVQNWTASSMRNAPIGVVPAPWKRYVLDDTGTIIDNKAYVFALLEASRAALKRRDLFTAPSIRFADPRRGLLEGEAWQAARLTVCRSLGRSLVVEAELGELTRQLDHAYRQTAANLPSNPDARIERRHGRDELVVSPLDRSERSDSLIALQAAVRGRLPRVDLPDILLEVAARTGFAEAFTHVSEQHARVDGFTTSLCAVLLAEACNIGFEPMIRTDQAALGRARLSWVGQNFLRPETIAAANAHLVAAHNQLEIARIWGSGEIASADGIRFVAPSTAIHAGPNPKYFGIGRGITYYNLVSDQFTGLNAVVVPGTLKDSLLILGLLLDQETDLEPVEIMTDTGAYTDCVFGLFWLLGYQFSPRLADIGGARLWRINRHADYGPLNGLDRHYVNIDLIARHWEDLLRLAGSLKLGRVHAGNLMRMLQVKDRLTSLAKALAELGRIIKTLHVLGYVDDEERRRIILTQLNRHELRHKLARKVCHGERGEIKKTYRQGQEEQLGALGLVLNIIVLWNATYIQAAISQLKREGGEPDTVDVARISPLAFKHINFLGRYAFSLPKAVADGKLRPLRNPTNAYDF
jgi:TnpA family transposase